MDKTSTCAVIVTFNRPQLLLQCLNAVTTQTFLPQVVVIVDNHSSAATTDILVDHGYINACAEDFLNNGGIASKMLQLANKQVITIYYYRLDANYGGAGGFNLAMRYFYQHTDCDQVWLMDDDCKPDVDALSELITAYEHLKQVLNLPVGYVCSQVKWQDQTACKLANPLFDNLGLDYFTLVNPYIKVKSCSFVSVLFSRQTVKRCGLPIKEFFIWHDDIEYTQRVAKQQFLGFVNLASIVHHCTRQNECVDLNHLKADNFYKFKYGYRNELITYRLIRNKFPLVPLLKLLRNIVIARIPLRCKFSLLPSLISGVFRKVSIEYV